MLVRTERGWPGHYCCGSRCTYHRNTLLQYENRRFVVSTVGNMRLPGDSSMQEIGAGRYYETMAFEARLVDGYWDSDVAKGIRVSSDWAIAASSPSELPDDVDTRADAMHEAVVGEVSAAILAGAVRYYEREPC